GEGAAHWLAVRGLTLNAHFLQGLLPGAAVVPRPHDSAPAGAGLSVLDPHPFLREDEGRPGCLPHRWEVTSDSIAARAAVLGRARRLILLKSVTFPQDL